MSPHRFLHEGRGWPVERTRDAERGVFGGRRPPSPNPHAAARAAVAAEALRRPLADGGRLPDRLEWLAAADGAALDLPAPDVAGAARHLRDGTVTRLGRWLASCRSGQGVGARRVGRREPSASVTACSTSMQGGCRATARLSACAPRPSGCCATWR